MTQNNENKLPKREELQSEFKWKIEDIYKYDIEWEVDFKEIKNIIPKITFFKGKLKDSADTLLKCLDLNCDMLSLNDKLFVYAKMKKDENNQNSIYQALTDRAFALSTEVFAAQSFIIPELISIEENTLKSFINGDNKLMEYKQFIDEALRQKEHVLSEKEEALLALSGEIGNAPKDIFTMFNNADIKFPFVKDENGEDVELTKGRYSKFLESSDRNVRKNAFIALTSTYKKYENTLATTFLNSVKSDKFYSSIRKYPSTIVSALDSDNISINVYDSLISAVNDNLDFLHRYCKLRKKVLGVDELHMYDLHTPMVKDFKKEISYDEALKLVKQGLMPLGSEYIKNLEEGFKKGWIDVYENEGKTSGAYSWGAYKTHPYVLLNYQGTINDVFTIAHEMGHALHSFYTNKTQPYIYSEYKIFVAEVASTVNESLLIRHLINNSSDKNEKAYLLNHYLEEFRGTVFRQVMFAEFEKIVHQKVQEGEGLTSDALTEIYLELNSKYFGDEVVIDKEIGIEWARIPHFYNSFYVYKYATGFSAATSISEQILSEGETAIGRYMEFLKGGSSDYPLELLKKAGVDLFTPKPIIDALKTFGVILEELEGLIG